MRLTAVSFLAALIAAPLAAQAAQPPARYAVTLQGRVVDRLTYELDRVEEDCRIHREGSGGRELQLRSVRATTIEVRRSGSRVAFRPARLVRVRVTGSTTAGAYEETRICRGAPIKRTPGNCGAQNLPTRTVRLGLRRTGRNRIVVPAGRAEQGVLCGLGRQLPFALRLDLAPARVDEDALINGRSLRVVARGSATRESAVVEVPDDPNLDIKGRATIRWTLTFRRL